MIEQLIQKALNTFTKEVVEDNSYTPRVRVQSTVHESKGTFNEVFENIHKQLKQ